MRRSLELVKNWKVPIPATVAGRIELVLTDPITHQPKYGARSKLITALLEHWLDQCAGKPLDECKALPTLDELRSL